ncbi:MAG: CvpA family protein [Clostridia bacterium]|nr:CvpA family protein [Clostridia bacterium]
MYPNSMMFAGIFAALILIWVVLGVLLAIKRGFFPSLIRLVMIAACFAVAFFLASFLAVKLTGYADGLMQKFMGDSLAQIETHSPSTADLIHHLPVALMAPALFVSIFFLLKWLTLIVFRVLKAILPSRSSLLFRLLGGVTGALSSLICVLVILLPLWGTLHVGHHTILTLSEADLKQNGSLSATVEKIEKVDTTLIAPATDNLTAEIFTDQGSNILYDSLTKFQLQGQDVILGDEVIALSQTAADALTFADTVSDGFEITNMTAEQESALRSLIEDVDHSDLLRNISAEWIVAIADAWQKDEAFMGIAPPAVDANIKPLVQTLLGYVASTDESKIAEDLNTFVDLLALIPQGDLSKMLTNNVFLNDLATVLGNHERFRDFFAEWLADLGSAWSVKQPFDGLSRPATNEMIDPLLNSLFAIIGTTNGECIGDDLEGLSEITGIMNKYEILNAEKSEKEIASLLSKGTIVTELTAVLTEHERFAPILDTVTGLGLSMISSQLSISLPDSDTLKDLSANVSTTLNGILDKPAEEQKEAIVTEVEKAIQDYKVDVPEGVSDMVAQTIVNKFGSAESISEQNVSEHLAGLYDSVGDLDSFFK